MFIMTEFIFKTIIELIFKISGLIKIIEPMFIKIEFLF